VTYENISVELTPASVGAITLNRPESLNALTSQMLDEMRDGGDAAARAKARAACC
jgi:enoyl-CoA hydratase/carnithine racemase